MTLSKYLLAGLITFLFASATFAEVYRWVDKSGHVQYSDQPPPDITAQKINAKPATGSESATSVKSYQAQDQEFKKRRVEEAEASKKQSEVDANAQTKKKNCEDAKSHLASLKLGGRIAKTNEKGERIFLDDKARDGAIVEAQKSVSSWCK